MLFIKMKSNANSYKLLVTYLKYVELPNASPIGVCNCKRFVNRNSHVGSPISEQAIIIHRGIIGKEKERFCKNEGIKNARNTVRTSVSQVNRKDFAI